MLTAGYTGDGQRAWKGDPNGNNPRFFLYDGDKVVEELTASGAYINTYGYGPGGLVQRYIHSIPAYIGYTFDPQGSVVQRQNAQGYGLGYGAAWQSVYEGYGGLRSNVQVSQSSPGGLALGQPDPFGFGGQFGYYTDTETGNGTTHPGLLCLTHRYYDPGTGRFVTRDPAGYGGGVNLYGFAGDNPVNETDPDGTSPAGDAALGWLSAGADATQDPFTKGIVSGFGMAALIHGRGLGGAARAVGSGFVHSYTDVFNSPSYVARGASAFTWAQTLSTFALGGAAGASGRATSVLDVLIKPNLEELPTLGMRTAEFGRFIGWGNTGEQAAARMKSLTNDDIQAMAQRGLTKKIATQWADGYLQLHGHVVSRTGQIDRFANPFNRSMLMRSIARRLPR